ncbi:hypothetical protein GE21DRAFT_6612 [Neurospora crassa]|uniref:RING-type E3 ubiquitin transferase n=1 Tax=Neurospora crassa (strain ATCC 24698 / 74-OR23-1A / CBS 708.71 / DSM 1257 / FGSC 987) TaxID=367110 RepID=Q7S8M0_NEUCR|nr:hypothetical protein NCU05314 [Neurospora crassa OR74A]EAA32691.1 hypothetical protein NCU05314 [Neurospora crassa OR74A]KHE84926.1 hypothetical protein GE21DRAFT_6612 [Neurospora crassa]|eukprot:XP_961927.1 hypothetical protein NCU05314 [Neurospora crassa OR74A]
MASPGFPPRHLDATTGREVVYCYGCENEWYRDDYPHLDLECPRCHNDFVQIVEPDNDPRPGVQQQGHRSDSDPEEDDIEQFLERGPGSFFMRRSVYQSPDSPFNRSSGNGLEDLDSSPDRPRARPDDPGEAVLSRFADMFVELSGARPGQQGGNAFGTQPRIQRTTFTRAGDGMASFTFTTTTTAGGPAGDGPEAPAFDTLFRGLFGNIPPPGAEDPGGGQGQGQGGGPRGPPLGFATGLQDFIATLLNPQAAVHGDAVYTQEALDRIITTLMEANPQSNAAPPATQAAIEKLPKKILDEQMVGPEGKAECTICIDDMYKGEEVTVLPCKHWFHGECVTLWLKEHNTCPICRMPIEGNNPSGSNSNNNNNNNSQPSASRQEASTNSASAFASSSAPGRNPFESLNPFGSQAQSARERLRRSEQEREERLERIRNVAGIRRTDSQSEGISRRTSHSPPSRENSRFDMRSRDRDPSPPRDRGTSTAWQPNPSSNSQSNISSRYSGGLNNLWGRNNGNNGEGNSRDRDGQQQQNQQQQQQQQSSSSGNGALGWLRDHFGRGSSGSGSGADRDRERRR